MASTRKKLGSKKSSFLLLSFLILLPLFSTSVTATNWNVNNQTEWGEGYFNRTNYNTTLTLEVPRDSCESGWSGPEAQNDSTWYTEGTGALNLGGDEGNTPEPEMYKDFNLDGGTLYFDINVRDLDGGSDDEAQLRIDGSTVWVTTNDGLTKTPVSVNISSYSGTHTVKFYGKFVGSDYGGQIIDFSVDNLRTSSYYSDGLWSSPVWDTDAVSFQKIDYLRINASVGVNESVKVRLGVDTDDDGTIDSWSHSEGDGVSVSDGSNMLDGSDFGLPPGYRYKIEYNLSITDGYTSHTPSISSFELETHEGWLSNISLSPEDGKVLDTVNPVLNATLEHNNSENMNVSFYDASDDSLIEKVTGVSSGSTASITWSSLQDFTNYTWYIKVTDGTNTANLSPRSFRTENKELWTVSSQNDWLDWELGRDIRTVANNSQVSLTGKDAVGWWSMDEGTGTTAYDISGNNNDGTINGAIWTDGMYGNALSFDGSDDYTDLPSLLPNPSPKTVSLWLNPDTVSSSQRVIALRGSASFLPFWIAENSNGYISTWQNGNYHSDLTTISADTWTHLTAVEDGSTFTIYKNSQEVASFSSSPSTGSYYDSLGNDQGGMGDGWADYFNGKIDEVRIYDRALSESEIGQLYNRTRPDSFENSSIDSGFWSSRVWDAGTSVKQQVDGLEVNASVGVNESVRVRLGVDEDDDGSIDTWSHSEGGGVSVSDGLNSLGGGDFDLSSGYRYQAEFNLSVTDGNFSHSPGVGGFELFTRDGWLDVAGYGPADGKVLETSSPELNVSLEHREGEDMNVSFYDASDGSLIEKVTGVSSGGTASVTWSGLEDFSDYSWYVVVSDGSDTVSLSERGFRVETGEVWRVVSGGDWGLGSFSNTTTEAGSLRLDRVTVVPHDSQDGLSNYPVDLRNLNGVDAGDYFTDSYYFEEGSGSFYWNQDGGSSNRGVRYWLEGQYGFPGAYQGAERFRLYLRTTPLRIDSNTAQSDGLAVDFFDENDNLVKSFDVLTDKSEGSSAWAESDWSQDDVGTVVGADGEEWYVFDSSNTSKTVPSSFDSVRMWNTVSNGDTCRMVTGRIEFFKGSEKGFWRSNIWDAGTSVEQQVNSLKVNASIGNGEKALVRLGVDTDDDGSIESWSHSESDGVSLSDGLNTFKDNDFNLSGGYRYQIETNLSVTDSGHSHSPSIDSFKLMINDVNKLPTVSNPSPSGGKVLGSTVADLDVNVSDADGDSMDAWFFNANNNEQIGSKQTEINGSGSASVSWTGLEANTTYNWYVNVSDGKGNYTSDTFTFEVGLGINLTFRDASVVEDGFNVYTNSSGTWKKVHSFQSNNVGGTGQRNTNFIDKNLEQGEKACYRIAAFNEAGESQKSQKACVTS
ncbi:MAG: LamG domain-containing protein [Candidatus Nanohaloarchaeota archaeon QJJ-9]|nr:LamG domain-containing protein [Candidatus Nanohaloarchaeota archaeon QJJ-9]